MALVFIFLQQCQDKWNICVGEEEGGFGCLPKYYECLNEYTVSSRKIENEEYVIIQPSMVNCDTKNLLPPPPEKLQHYTKHKTGELREGRKLQLRDVVYASSDHHNYIKVPTTPAFC